MEESTKPKNSLVEAAAKLMSQQNEMSEMGESRDIDFEREYHYRVGRAIRNLRAGRPSLAAAQQKFAEDHAEAHFKKTGKKVYDPLYLGKSNYISALKESLDEPAEKTKNARRHWNGAKKSVGEGFLGLGKKKKVEPVKKDAWPDISKNPKAWSKAQEQDRKDAATAAYNRWKQKKPDGSSIHARESAGEIDHEDKFWNHLRLANEAVSENNAHRHSVTALGHAKLHFDKTGKKIDAEGILDGLPTGHEHYLKY
jgi:hypothetical protein